jgi:hypothetical protein
MASAPSAASMPQKRTERQEKRCKDVGDEAAWPHVADALIEAPQHSTQ